MTGNRPVRGGVATPATGSGRGGSTAGSTRAASKYRPRGNRRTEAERERIAEEQERIQNKKIADDARQRSRGRFRRAGRSRGGFRDREARFGMGNGLLADGTGESIKCAHIISFSCIADQSRSAAPGPGGAGFRGGMGGGGFGGGFRGKGGFSRASSSKYSFADGIAEDDRINADELRGRTGESDDEELSGAKITSTARRKRPIMPVGIRREEFQDKGITVATAADIEDEEKGLVKEEETSDSDEMWVGEPNAANGEGTELKEDEGVWEHVAPKPRGKVKIKREDGEVIETMDIDEIAAHSQIKEPSSPEAKKKAALVSDQKPATKRKAAPRDPEDETLSQDLEQLLSLLALEPDQGEGLGVGEAQAHSALEGNMFLFQFPPVLPPLKKSTEPPARSLVKDEPDDDIVMLDQPVKGSSANVDLTADEVDKVKKEEGDEDGLEDTNDTSDPYKEGGYVGQLIMRKSGKVELSWGGQTLELVSGTPTQFLTSAVLVEEKDSKAKAGQFAGTAFGMGKIEGKFVLAPKWGEEEEWEIDPDELPPNDAEML